MGIQPSPQFKQTLISAGCVGAVFGVIPALAVVAFRSDYATNAAQSISLIDQAAGLALLFVGSILFCVVFSGLLPMALQYDFVRLVRRWTGRA
jgi:hypothetical protein